MISPLAKRKKVRKEYFVEYMVKASENMEDDIEI